MDWIRSWVETSPYGRSLGVECAELSPERARLVLPFDDSNSNGDGALHGGVAASMIDVAGQALARAALGEASGPWSTTALQVAYLSAALGEGIEVCAELLRRGKELLYADVSVRTESGKPVARGLSSLRGRFGDPEVERPLAAGDDGAAEPGPMGAFIHRLPFHAKLGIAAEHMAGGRSRIVMPWKDDNADAAGGVHEGAVLALLDTTGAMAGWAETGPGRYKASTPGIQARILAPPPRGDLVGYGGVLHHDRELLFSRVEVAEAASGRLVAEGTVNYRIVQPHHAR